MFARAAPCEATFGPDELSGYRARRFVRTCLAGAVPESMSAAAAAVAAELVTNAIRHAGTSFTVTVVVDGAVRVEVADGDPRLPAPRRVAPDGSVSGGLHLVGDLARRWGAIPTASGKVVWAELDRSA